ncbi:GPI biosynthesis protein family Pig-F-domain-containing protein [Crepidotus variabilis]|uniref:GPI biosynthesis protein family Pig-F-domain-containing protein n=1 Tax=Crepidotus variabilis TaxID=179855 RepID=A0A9P6EK12_9AGAR|nr:GPI biosynthesis protein family Pig-F-domain-containing protein [Crepidotus variabilis]
MANKKKPMPTKAPNTTSGTSTTKAGTVGSKPSIPIASYISIAGVHSTLWAFAVLFLPRTSFLSPLTTPEWDPTQLTSRDKPQHPFLEPLTLNPTATLLWICFGAAVLQTWWASWLRKWWLDIGLRGSDAEKRVERQQYDGQIFAMFRDAWLATLATTLPIHFILVLFGASFVTHVTKTYLLALLLSIMVVYPPALVIGIPTLSNNSGAMFRRWTWVRLFAEFWPRNLVERALVYPATGAVLGTWVGAFPIALDWDRPWQAWPLTPTFGAVAGFILASIASVTVSSIHQVLQEHAESQGNAQAKID